VAMDLSAGGGYTTEVLARAVGPSGRVYGQSPPPNPATPRPAAPEGAAYPAVMPMTGASAAPAMPAMPAMAPVRKTSAELLAERNKNPMVGNIIPVVRKFEDPIPAEISAASLDLVTLMFNYHDLGYQNIDRERMNRAVFAALKPGGMYVIADHAGRAGTGISEASTLHRMEEAFLIREVTAAGFKLAAQGDFLRNPADPRDKNTPVPAQPKDEFVVKFVKP
jgi:predicted methyltransferase